MDPDNGPALDHDDAGDGRIDPFPPVPFGLGREMEREPWALIPNSDGDDPGPPTEAEADGPRNDYI